MEPAGGVVVAGAVVLAGAVVVLLSLPSRRFIVGGPDGFVESAGLPLSVLAGGVVELSSPVGWRRLRVGRPGAPSSSDLMLPAVVARAFESRSSRALTR